MSARRCAASILTAVAIAAALPAAASAGFAASGNGELAFGARSGERNDVSIEPAGAEFLVTDVGALITAEPGCRALDPPNPMEPDQSHRMACEAVGITQLIITLDDLDDHLTWTVPVPAKVSAGDGGDTVVGGTANDEIFGDSGADVISGGGGDDTLVERILETTGNRLDGGPGSDALSGGAGPDTLLGGPGDDLTLAGRDGDDVIDGGDGNDTLNPGTGPAGLSSDADRLFGGPGIDLVEYRGRSQGVRASIGNGPDDGLPLEGDNVSADVERLAGTLGDDTLIGGPGPDELDGRGGSDTLDGAGGDDRLLSGAGDAVGDSLAGGPGNDALAGDGGGDRLAGGDGTDALAGGDGADDLDGGAGADALDGGAQDDSLDGGTGGDRMAGGAGVDTVRYAARRGPVEVTIDGAANDGEVTATGTGRTRVAEGAASEGDDVDATVENTTGGGAADTLQGDALANAIDGRAGEDVLAGGAGADVLAGGARSDAIMARDGTADNVSCGAGYDYVIADARDRVPAGARCDYVDDGTRRRPRARRDVMLAPRCARGADAEVSPPRTQRAVPFGRRALLPVGSRVDSLDCALRMTVATGRGRASTATIGRGSGEMRVTQRRAARGRVRTELRTSDCPSARSARRARVARFPRRRYRRRYGRIAFPVTVRTADVTMQTRPSRGAVTWDVVDRCGRGATTVRVTSGRLAVVDLASDRRVILGPGDRFATRG